MTLPSGLALPGRSGAGVLGTDYRVHEVAIAVGLALIVQGGAALALRAAALHRMAEAPDIDPGVSTPIAVRPVVDLDSPLLKLGGKKVKYKLPDRWLRQVPVKRVKRKAHVSTKAGQTEEDIPPEDLELSDAGTEPDPDAALAKEVDPDVEDGDAGPANVDTEGHADGVKEGTETDPLKARAISQYRARLISWCSRRFRVSGSGLSPEELAKHRVGASVQISNARIVTSYSIVPSGNATFDAAARSTLQGTMGQQLPPPPENYPHAIQNQISLTFVCTVNTCD